MDSKQNENAIIQNLLDAGCDNDTIAVFIKEMKEGKTADGLRLLDGHRRLLLDHLHKNQKQIDCLDYLVYILTNQAQKAR